MKVALVVADPATPDSMVTDQRESLTAAGGEPTLVDLRRWAPAPSSGPLPWRAVRAVVGPWWAARGLRGDDAATVDGADLVVAGDRFAVPAVWRRRRHTGATLVHGIPAALRELAG